MYYLTKISWSSINCSESEEDGDTTPVVVTVTREAQLPDFGQSPINSQHSEQSDQETPRNSISGGKQIKLEYNFVIYLRYLATEIIFKKF